MCSYTPFVRRTTKWYIRLLFHIITQTMVVNAWVLYQKIMGKIKLNLFKRRIFLNLLEAKQPTTPSKRHKLEKIGSYREGRKRCRGCYQKYAKTEDSRTACKKSKYVSTRCSNCLCHYCLECFNAFHTKCTS